MRLASANHVQVTASCRDGMSCLHMRTSICLYFHAHSTPMYCTIVNSRLLLVA